MLCSVLLSPWSLAAHKSSCSAYRSPCPALQDHTSQMLTVRSIFLYLDRTYVISTTGIKSLFEMGLHLFRLHLATHPEVTSCRILTGVIPDES